MKKLLAIILIAVMLSLTFAGCSETADVNATTESTTAPTTTTTTTTRTTEDVNTTFKEPATNTVYPALTKDEDGSYPYKLSTYTTYYDSSNSTRTVNINNAVSKLDNLKIPDGATFSFNQTVGKRTVLAGYQEAKVVKGDEFVDGLGGGICQVSSTIFQAALRANMDITVRACHSLEISYVPLGADATVQWNTQDFQFKNNSGTDIRLSVSASKGTLICEVYAADDINVGDVDIQVSKDGSSYILKRSVNGTVNYT
ncbi:MAG: VanW family protein, partial [Eubacterium sp.]|nr:VanW family protein [Eubacterium sp.]